ncbi:hypothetical protein HNY73_008796 [Argiope bruennichi]|uniref:Uncharacterized protein n=1 Tax=Argiope bruennichi TaxID=94029 RepID=A0A8T0F9U9_ARGBR|nr:hypothetical protein HNY73_008796 [Argiope bruennichi]
MACTQSRCKTFLISSNVALLFVGLSVFILGLKMKDLLSVLLLIDVPLIAQAVKAVIATGFFISVAGITGIGGACYETLWMILLHLVALGIIVVMEFGLGVTLLIVRKTVENYIANKECNNSCAATLDSLVLDYALPSAGLMLTIIIIEATMMYSAIKLWYHIKESPKVIESPIGDMAVQNVQMRNVGTPLPSYSTSPHPVFSPSLIYLPNRRHPVFATNSPLPRYPSHLEPTKPPQYDSLSPDLQQPPTYMEVVPGALTNRASRMDEMDRRPASCNSV